MCVRRHPLTLRPPPLVAATTPAPHAASLRDAHTFEETVKPFIKSNCLTCHSARRKKGDLNLEQYQSIDAVTEDADRWEEVIRKLRAGEMPPPEEEEPRPEPEQVEKVTGLVEQAIARADAARGPTAGRVTARRLNRAEYNNTVRDLLGVDLRLADGFPQDDSGYGFDNIGDVLSLSPVLMEKYLAAAEQIARTAVFGPEPLKPALTKLQPLTGRIQPSPTPLDDYDLTGLTLPNALHATPADSGRWRVRPSAGHVRWASGRLRSHPVRFVGGRNAGDDACGRSRGRRIVRARSTTGAGGASARVPHEPDGG